MKKLFALSATALLALGLASCGEEKKPEGGEETNTPKTIKLEYSGTASDKKFNLGLFEDFKAARKAAGDKNTYEIEYLEHGPDKVDSEIQSWDEGPDVYEFASDKITDLYKKGALAKLTNKQTKWVKDNNNELGFDLASFNGSTYAYPYTGDNTYYFQYNKSLVTDEQAKSIEGIFEACKASNKKLGYNIQEGFWGGGAMFTFGADYSMKFTVDGSVKEVSANFNEAAGLKAAKAIQNIVTSQYWTNDMKVPTEDNELIGCIAGTWDIANYKEALGDDYGCAPMPTITIDGDTKHLGAFLGGKLLGVNPSRSAGDKDRIKAAHELAMYLSGEKAQEKRFDNANIAPCNLKAAALDKVTSNANIKVLVEQAKFAHAQTSVPGNFWSAPTTLVAAIKDNKDTPDNIDLQKLIDAFNQSVKDSK